MEWKVYNMSGEQVGTCELDSGIFQGEVNQPLLREAIIAYQANLRQGTASTKSRNEVRGGGRKPWPQKGTGRARAGSIRSPLWVGGGVAFGPKPRDFSHKLPKKKRKLALVSALRLKLQEGRLFILDNLAIEQGKTREMASFLKNFSQITSQDGKTLIVIDRKDEKILRASSNIKDLGIALASNICGYNVISFENLFFTQSSLSKLTERLK